MLKSSFCKLYTDCFLTVCSSLNYIIFVFIVLPLMTLCTQSSSISNNAMVSSYFVLFVVWKDVLVNGSKLKHSLKESSDG